MEQVARFGGGPTSTGVRRLIADGRFLAGARSGKPAVAIARRTLGCVPHGKGSRGITVGPRLGGAGRDFAHGLPGILEAGIPPVSERGSRAVRTSARVTDGAIVKEEALSFRPRGAVCSRGRPQPIPLHRYFQN